MANGLITLTCPSCGGKTLLTEDQRQYICQYCGNQHILKDRPMAPLKPRVSQPEKVSISRGNQQARLVKRWFSFKYVPMAFFAVGWDAFLIFWYSMALQPNMPWIMAVFPIAHLAVGVGITYSVLAGFFNRTILEVTRDEIAVWFEPLPWIGEVSVKTGDVKQFFCKETHKQSKNGSHSQYQLFVILNDDRQVKLLSDLEDPEIALFFEQQLETWLRITDRPVAGEMA